MQVFVLEDLSLDTKWNAFDQGRNAIHYLLSDSTLTRN